MGANGVVKGCGGRQRRGETRGSSWHAILGGALILAGLALLAERAGVVDIGVVWEHWPLIPIVVGAAGLLFAPSGERWGGFWLLVSGLYCAIGVWNPFGLSWGSAWPIFLVAVGIQMLVEMAVDRPAGSPKTEADDVR